MCQQNTELLADITTALCCWNILGSTEDYLEMILKTAFSMCGACTCTLS